MKQANKNIFHFCILCLLVILVNGCKTNQEALLKTEQLVESGRYTFVARTAIPTTGRSINLSPNYVLKISSDTIESYLPYFGVAHSPITPGADGGIKFTSKKFSKEKIKTKSGWEINIKTDDVTPQYRLSLQVGEGGYTTLHVSQNSKQPISFYGVVE